MHNSDQQMIMNNMSRHLSVSRVDGEYCLQISETVVTEVSVSHQLVRCGTGPRVEITTDYVRLVHATS